MKVMKVLFLCFILFGASANVVFAQQDSIVIGIFRDKRFEGHEVPKSLQPEYFQYAWGKFPGVKIMFLDIDQIRSYTAVFKHQMDVLVFPYGGLYPMEAFGYYSGQSFNYFLRNGGAVVSTGEVPFSKQTDKRLSTPGKSDSLNINQDAYDKWIARFGVKYYVATVPPSISIVNTDFLPAASGLRSIKPGNTGIVVNNSSHEPVPKPSNGNVFPERFPARQIIPLLQGSDRFGKIITTGGLLVQDFENGSRQLLIADAGEPHLLSPSPQLPGVMDDLFRLVTNKVIAKDIECNYACYRQGETVEIKGEFISFERNPVEVEVRVEVRDSARKVVFTQREQVRIFNKNALTRTWHWSPGKFASDEYTTSLRIFRDGKAVSETENGFVVWSDAVVQRGPGIGIKNEYFAIGNGESFIAGTNYYESTRGEIMWFRPDVKNITRDIREMHVSGVNYIRPHYHHLKWFKDYLLYHHRTLFEFYRSLEKMDDPLPDERGWRIWDMFIYLTQKYQMVYGGDLFTLVPEDMGDPRGWWGTTETIYNLTGRAVQKKFLQQLSQRYASVKGISWDLFNEPFDIPNEDIENWAKDLRETLEENKTKRLVSVGGSHGLSKDVIDYETPHGIPPASEYNDSGIPMLMQELHIDRKEGFDAEKDQAETLREQYTVVIRNGYAGICPWSWSRQMRLWQDSYEHHYSFTMEKWDDRLGLHTHDDGTYKLAGQVFRDMSIFIKSISLQDYNAVSKRVSTTKGEVIAAVHNGISSVFHVNGNKCFAAMHLDSIHWAGDLLLKGPSLSYVYLFSPDGIDIRESKTMLLKSEKAGTLQLPTRKGKPKKILLVDVVGGEHRILKELEGTLSKGNLVIYAEPEFTTYWIEIIW